MKPHPHDIYLVKLGLNIRRIREEASITMTDLASKAEMEYRQLGRIERGEINTSVISLLKIADALEISIQQFFDFKTKASNNL